MSSSIRKRNPIGYQHMTKRTFANLSDTTIDAPLKLNGTSDQIEIGLIGLAPTQTIDVDTPSQPRKVRLVDAGADSEFVTTEGDQKLNGEKEITDLKIANLTTAHANLTDTKEQIRLGPVAGPRIKLSALAPAANRDVKFDDPGTDTSVITAHGNQSIPGTKTCDRLIITPQTSDPGLEIKGSSAISPFVQFSHTTDTGVTYIAMPVPTTEPGIASGYLLETHGLNPAPHVLHTGGGQSVAGITSLNHARMPTLELFAVGGNKVTHTITNPASDRTILWPDPGTNTGVMYTAGGQTVGGTTTMNALVATTLSVTNSLTLPTTTTGPLNMTGNIVTDGALLDQSRSGSGVLVESRVRNTSNTANSTAIVRVSTAGGSAGDAMFRAGIEGVQDWTWGCDNSDGDAFVMARGTTLGTNNTFKITTSDVWTFVQPTVDHTVSTSGGTVLHRIANTSNTASSNAELELQVGGTSGEDPFIHFSISGSTDWATGTDNSDSDKFKISQANHIGTNDAFTLTTTRYHSFPGQPRFEAYKSSNSTNATGDGTVVTLVYDTESHDNLGNYNNSTGTFTAPVAGFYQFNGTIGFGALGAGHTTGVADFVVNIGGTPVVHNIMENNSAATRSAGSNKLVLSWAKGILLAANDTVNVRVAIFSSTKTVTILGSSVRETHLSGYLVSAT